MKVLHICSDYSGSKVHYNLYRSLDKLIDSQTVYAYYDSNIISANNSFSTSRSEVVYDDILNQYLRKIYPLREWWVYYNLKKKINPSSYDCIHATTLFGDGGIAFKIYKKYRIPYIVAVRSTDILYIDKYPNLLLSYVKRIIDHASSIVFVNQTAYNHFESFAPLSTVWARNADKMIVVPNGINDYWIDNIFEGKKINNHKIGYAGLFYKRKNVIRLIEAVCKLRSEFPDLQLDIAGDNGPDEAEINRLSEKFDFIHLNGRITEKKQMLDFYRRNSIFAMPSWGETFGLVYVEALTQKMRLLYSKGEGIDGLFADVGVGVNPFSVDSISAGLRELIVNFDNYTGANNIKYGNLRWESISSQYMNMYLKATRQ